MGTRGWRVFPIWTRCWCRIVSHSFISAVQRLLDSWVSDWTFIICVTISGWNKRIAIMFKISEKFNESGFTLPLSTQKPSKQLQRLSFSEIQYQCWSMFIYYSLVPDPPLSWAACVSSFIVMEFVTTKRRPKQFSMKVISMFWISEDKMVVSSGGVWEAAAASGSLCTLQVCTNIQNGNIELLEM